ncbi:MAG TPA: SEFIR domain-containing protein [Thermoanaerobaculia bacterium]|nr:SEFIR domain-containing protein [Thermoanaerobaculia bacterium]
MTSKPKIVFISYSHDSTEHRRMVLRLSERLRADGLETRLDQYVNGTPVNGWARWMLDQLDEASRVVVVCTETYYRHFRGHELQQTGKGVDWEGARISQEIYDAGSRTKKFVPVLFDPSLAQFIPEPLRQYSHYVLTSEAGYQRLYDELMEQGGVEPHAIGAPKVKKRPRGKPLEFVDSSGSAVENMAGHEADLIPYSHVEDWRSIPLPTPLPQGKASSQATSALVIGIAGVICCSLAAPFAWYLANRELRLISTGQSAVAGQGVAQAARILGLVGMALLVLSLIWILFAGGLPFLQAMAANAGR